MDTRTQGRLTLLGIAALFILPIVVAAFMYFGEGQMRPGSSTEYGLLVQPPRLLPADALTQADTGEKLREIWTMVVISEGNCNARCRSALVKMRQIRLALGPKMARIQTVFVPINAAALNTELRNQHPKLIIAGEPMAGHIHSVVKTTDMGADLAGEIYLIDPLGNLMMSYGKDAEMSGIRKDLTKLFKLSTIG